MQKSHFQEDEGFSMIERPASNSGNDELRFQEQEVLSCSGEGLLPGLTKAFRAPKLSQHPFNPT